MKPKIVEIAESLNIDAVSAEKFASAIIDECVFAFLMNYEGKINPLSIKELLDDALGLNEFYFDDESPRD
jgi:hypothetical protein